MCELKPNTTGSAHFVGHAGAKAVGLLGDAMLSAWVTQPSTALLLVLLAGAIALNVVALIQAG